MKLFAIATSGAALLMSAALADPIHSPNMRDHPMDAPTPNPEAVFAPIVPCRAFGGQSLSVNTPRHFVVSGPTSACGVPASATAVTISLTATSSSGSGSVTAYPYGATRSSTRALSFHSGQDDTASAIIGLGSNSIALRANGSSIKIAGDITGYYSPQIEAYIYPDGSIYSRTARILSVTHTDTGIYTIEVDRDVSKCAIQLTPGIGAKAGVSVTGSEVQVSTYGPPDMDAEDEDFYFSVNC